MPAERTVEGRALQQMLSATLMMNVVLCRFLERKGVMKASEFAAFVEAEAKAWPTQRAHDAVISQFLRLLRDEAAAMPTLH